MSLRDYYGTCMLIFNACAKRWKLSYAGMAELIEKYRLASYIEEDFEYLNAFGIEGCVDEIEDYIICNGGVLNYA